MPLVVATRAKLDPDLESLSRIRYCGACPNGAASLRCWATQGSDGERVTPTWMTLRDCNSMKKKAKSGRKNRSLTGKRVAGPDLCGVSAQKRAPLLPSWLLGANLPHIFLDRALADAKAQFQEFPANALGTPESILPGYLPDQGDGV